MTQNPRWEDGVREGQRILREVRASYCVSTRKNTNVLVGSNAYLRLPAKRISLRPTLAPRLLREQPTVPPEAEQNQFAEVYWQRVPSCEPATLRFFEEASTRLTQG